MDSLKRAMAWDEKVYGREYDLDVFNIVAVSDFNMGAMENKGLNVFNDKYVLASQETATDDDYAGIEGVIAHEYFHNWTGNRVTCRDWFQLCLKEGLTVFRDQEFSADMRSAPVKRISEVRAPARGAVSRRTRARWRTMSGPRSTTRSAISIPRRSIRRAPRSIRMLKRLIGDDSFRAGMDMYFHRYDGCAATVEQFIGCFADVSGRDLGRFMRWYSQAGTPKVKVRTAYDPEARTYRLDIAQSLGADAGPADQAAGDDADRARARRPARRRHPARLRRRHGGRTRLGRLRPRRRRARDRVPRRATTAGPVVPARLLGAGEPRRRPHRGRIWPCSPGTTPTISTAGRRCRASSPACFCAAVKAIRGGRAPERNAGLIAAFGALIDDARSGRIDPAFAALALTLPTEADIAREIGADVDPDAIYAARKTLRGALGRKHGEALADLHDWLGDHAAFQPRRRIGGAEVAAQRRACALRRRQHHRRARPARTSNCATPTT